MNIVNEMFRSIPTTLSILTFIIYIITHDKFLFYLAFGMIISQCFVKTIKNIFSYFYSIFISNNNKNINLPILGRFSDQMVLVIVVHFINHLIIYLLHLVCLLVIVY